MWLPKRLESLEDGKLEPQWVEDVIVKILNAQGATRGGKLPEQMRLPYALIEPILSGLRTKDMIGTTSGGSGIGGNAGLNFGLTEKGAAAAQTISRRSPYFGPAPVELGEYIEACNAQKFNTKLIKKQHLDRAFSDIQISPEYVNTLGPAINSGGPIFLYGKPGNGKTTMAERVARLYRQGIFVPHAVQINGEIISVFDPKVHRPITADMLPDDHPLKENPAGPDPRWMYVFRPFIVVGGELTLEMLDLKFLANAATYEAPFQMKANGGVLLIDDFGRQKARPTEFLNRWIYPLEKGMDFLSLASGKKIEVPFDLMLILSTNLDPKDVGDEAFWRRIKYMIETPSPTEADYKKIFQTICEKKKIGFDDVSFEYLNQNYYKKTGREYRSVHPRDIISRIADHIAYFNLPPRLSQQVIDMACKSFFGQQQASGQAEDGTPAKKTGTAASM